MSESQRVPKGVVEQIQILSAAGGSSRQIARQLGIGKDTVEKYRVPRDPLLKEQKPSAIEIHNRQIDDYAKFHKERFLELQERFRKWVGDTGKHAVPKKGKSDLRLVCNDLHSPFINEEAFGCTIREAKDAGATRAVIPGDLMDQYAVSRYPKTRKKYSFNEEVQACRATLRTLAESFEEILLMDGNHDERFKKFLVATGVPPDVLEYLTMEYPTALSPLAKIAADFPNVHMLPVPEKENAKYPHIAQIGDTVFSHSEKFSIIAGKATADVNLYCQKKYIPMGIVQPYKVLIQAHTHAAARFFGDFGVLCIENGTLSQVPDYDGSPKLMGREPILGYTLWKQVNGVTDINATHFYRVR